MLLVNITMQNFQMELGGGLLMMKLIIQIY